jgi:hypothetical protein
MPVATLAYSSTDVATHPAGCVCPTHVRARDESRAVFRAVEAAMYRREDREFEAWSQTQPMCPFDDFYYAANCLYCREGGH